MHSKKVSDLQLHFNDQNINRIKKGITKCNSLIIRSGTNDAVLDPIYRGLTQTMH